MNEFCARRLLVHIMRSRSIMAQSIALHGSRVSTCKQGVRYLINFVYYEVDAVCPRISAQALIIYIWQHSSFYLTSHYTFNSF